MRDNAIRLAVRICVDAGTQRTRKDTKDKAGPLTACRLVAAALQKLVQDGRCMRIGGEAAVKSVWADRGEET